MLRQNPDLKISSELNGCNMLDIAYLRCKDNGANLEYVAAELVFANQFPGEGEYFWLARLKGEPVGYAHGEVHFGELESAKIYVLPEFRNQGIGKALKQAQIDLAKELGLSRIRAEIADDNLPSIRVSKAKGFAMEKLGRKYFAELRI